MRSIAPSEGTPRLHSAPKASLCERHIPPPTAKRWLAPSSTARRRLAEHTHSRFAAAILNAFSSQRGGRHPPVFGRGVASSGARPDEVGSLSVITDGRFKRAFPAVSVYFLKIQNTKNFLSLSPVYLRSSTPDATPPLRRRRRSRRQRPSRSRTRPVSHLRLRRQRHPTARRATITMHRAFRQHMTSLHCDAAYVSA